MADGRANTQTRIIERDLEKLSDRFDRHLEIYAQNGKELAALKTSVDSLKNAIEKQEGTEKQNVEQIWAETRKNTSEINDINVTLGKLLVRVSLMAAVASTLASSVVVYVIEAVFL